MGTAWRHAVAMESEHVSAATRYVVEKQGEPDSYFLRLSNTEGTALEERNATREPFDLIDYAAGCSSIGTSL